MAAIHSVIDGKYEILKLIGQGGMSKVYLAMDRRLNKQWAVKEIEKRARDEYNQVVVQSAIVEANMIKRLDHPALPRIVDIIDNGNVIFVIMDYIEGEPLSRYLEKNGAQPQTDVIEWAIQLCDVLQYLHTRQPPIIYRDMKPANVMLRPDSTVKLIDFGIAREYNYQNISDTINLGTKGYAAPEQFANDKQTDARTDIYCLGVTMYHLVTGQNPCEPPYELYPIRHWNPLLSGGLEKIIQKCTQMNPEDRYQSCAELMYALEHYEEYDDEYLQQQKKKLNLFGFVASACVFFLLVGIVGNFLRVRSTNSNYDTILLQAQNTADEDEKKALYLNAIDIKPTEISGYMALIETIKQDAVFSLEEEKDLRQKLNGNLAGLQANPEYALMAFEIGSLYWHYYDYGRTNQTDNQLTRMKAAIPWFEDAVSFGQPEDSFYIRASIYCDIGKFNRGIALNIVEATDTGEYGKYWESLEAMAALIQQHTGESDIVKLEFYKLVVSALETYSVKFKTDGVTQKSMQTMYDMIVEQISSLTPVATITQQMKEEISRRLPHARRAIETAY